MHPQNEKADWLDRRRIDFVEVNMNTDKIRELNIQLDLLQKDYEMLVAKPHTRRKHFDLLQIKTEIARAKTAIGILGSKNPMCLQLAKKYEQNSSEFIAKDVVEISIKKESSKIMEDSQKIVKKINPVSKKRKQSIKKRMCSNKVVFITKIGAEKRTKNLFDGCGKTMRVYKCPSCLLYHLTSQI